MGFSGAGVMYWAAVALAALALVAAALGFRWGCRHQRPLFAWVWAGLIGAFWMLGVWATFIEPELLVVHRETVASPRWSGPPVRLGLIADSHVGAPHMSAARMARIVQRMNAEHPDIVLLLGDYVGGHQSMDYRSQRRNAQVLDGMAAFKDLKAPLGVAGIIGNHDLWYDKDAVRQGLMAANVTVLDDSATEIHRPGGDFWLAGIADLQDIWYSRSLKPAFAAVPAGAPSILMAHEPDAVIVPGQPYALMVAGHTHCGQINLPILGRIAIGSHVEQRYSCHLYWRGDQALFVSGGLGVSNLPVRFRAPPEIDIITLTAAAPNQGRH
jgi:predicted MPP superfamily phosphohydrolase